MKNEKYLMVDFDNLKFEEVSPEKYDKTNWLEYKSSNFAIFESNNGVISLARRIGGGGEKSLFGHHLAEHLKDGRVKFNISIKSKNPGVIKDVGFTISKYLDSSKVNYKEQKRWEKASFGETEFSYILKSKTDTL